MTRVLLGVLFAALAAVLAAADDPPRKLTPQERKELEARWDELNAAGVKAFGDGKYPEATRAFQDALDVARKAYPKADFPDGHANLATGLNNLGALHKALGRLAEAEPLYKESLDMTRRLFPGDHTDVAVSLNNLAVLYKVQGKLAAAEPLYKEALGMEKRLYKGDHPDVALTVGNLAVLYQEWGKLAEAEPLHREALAMRRRLFKGDHPDVASSLNNLAFFYRGQGELAAAEPLYRDALAMFQRLYPGDHPHVARSLNNLALVYVDRGKLAEAEPLHREALAMRRRLFKGDHPDVAMSLNNLAALCESQGRLTESEARYKDALGMLERLLPGDHPLVASVLNNLAFVYRAQGRLAEAEPLFRRSLAVRRRLFPGDHPDVAGSMSNLAGLYSDQGKAAEAEPLHREALAMYRRLHKGDHPTVALALNNLAVLCDIQGRLAEAEALYNDALAMNKRLHKGDHPDVAALLHNLAGLYSDQGKAAEAEPLFRDSLAMRRRLVIAFARQKAEGETLTLLAALPLTRDSFLSNELARRGEAGAAYSEVWASKALVARVYEQRLQAARAAAADPEAAKVVAELADARRRRAELILAPEVTDPATRQKREDGIQGLDRTIARLDTDLRRRLPAAGRAERLAAATPADLQPALPPDAAVVDFIRFVHFEQDRDRPGIAGEKQTESYLAFLVTRRTIAWINLGPAGPIEAAVGSWREAITGGREVPAELPGKVRELVWEKVRGQFPAGVKVVYIAPDVALCRVPWAALPGDKPGTVLLEDFAVATIPHSPFLLDQLWPRDEYPNPPVGVLAVGGVDYQAAPGAPHPAGRDLPLKPGARADWAALPGAAAEATGVAGAAAKKKFGVTPLRGEKATATALLAELPKARYAHLATHGFFADPSFRSVLQLDPKQFGMTRRGERVGAGALSPLLMTGLVLAGANDPGTPGRGIVTGESLIDLDLSGLELAVLSACETGLGDVAGGEGTFGLQRAFHLAGTRNVVASLWKVPDGPTAALMAVFYRKLWEDDLSPLEALRQAQLEIYRNPGKIPALAGGFRGKFDEVPGAKDDAITPTAGGKAHPRLWAAFTLSGPGR